MEGTRHERIALVITAYIIGFTTAFIAFGVSKISDDPLTIPTTIEKVQAYHQQNSQMPVIATMQVNKDGLFAVLNGYNRLLVVNANYLSASALSGVGEYGSFFKITDALVSTNGQFGYFCEQIKESDDFCVAYIYSLSDDSLYAVSTDGTPYMSKLDKHTASWSEGSLLTLDGSVSKSSSKPWILVTQ